jgi:fumarate hydratase subunit beta
MKEWHLNAPLKESDIDPLVIGDLVYLTGMLFTARIDAHRRMAKGEALPFDTSQYNILFHSGPAVKKIGNEYLVCSAGPTGSIPYNFWEAQVIRTHYLRAIIGKGGMSDKVIEAMKEVGCVYLNGIGGESGAYYATKIKRVKEAFWLDLGLPEALWVLEVEEFGPFWVAIDRKGNNLFVDRDRMIEKQIRKTYEELDLNKIVYRVLEGA